MRVTLMYHGEGPLTAPSTSVYADLFEQLALAESMGFDAVWFAEHHFTVHYGHIPQPLMFALATALRFPRLRVGTAVVCLPLHHPLEVAEQAAMVDVLSQGRLMLGVGSGSSPSEFSCLGISTETRRDRFREGIDVLLQGLSGSEFHYDGQLFHIPPTTVMPHPIQEPREIVWIAASGEPSAALAGDVGCGLMLPRGRTAAAYRDALDAHRASLKAAGYDSAHAQQAIARCVYVGANDEAAHRETEAAVASFYRRFTLLGRPTAGPLPPHAELVRALNMTIGGAETVRRELVDFGRETQISHLSIQPTWEQLDQKLVLASMRRFGESVLPALT